ncbi:hypothetical protein, partial [Klebsiella pneumoniae]
KVKNPASFFIWLLLKVFMLTPFSQGALLGHRARKVFLLFYRSNIYRVLCYEGKGVIMVYLIDN